MKPWRQILLHGLLCGMSFGAQRETTPDNMLFVSFRDPGSQGVYFAVSEDGYRWTALNDDAPWIVPDSAIGLMRDPFITRGPEAGFHLVWTCGNRKIGYAFTEDLRVWPEQRLIPLFADHPNVLNTWAPEMVYDAKAAHWIIFWSATLAGAFPETDGQVENEKNHRIYAVTTTDFESFSDPFLFFDPGYPVIDASLYVFGSTVYCIFKDERRWPLRKQLRVASGPTLVGPWSDISEPFTAFWTEGPSAISVGGQVMIYYDQYRNPQHMGAVITSDFITFEDVTDTLCVPDKFKHGSFIRITQEETKRLLLGPVRSTF